MADTDNDLKKRYWVLCWEKYYPCGSFGNVQFTTDSEEEALAYEDKHCLDYLEVWDMEIREMIKRVMIRGR